MKTLKLICIVILSLNIEANALIRNVPSQYSTIQSAINTSVNGDTVLVQPGTYFENLNLRGKNIVLTSLFYQNFNYSAIQSTIINGSTPVSPDSASCILIINHEDSTTVVQGFTITGGTGTKWTDEHGAGLFREGGGILIAFSNPIIQYNIITGNQAITGGVVSTGGGGMRIGDCYARVYNNIISNNTGYYGAGIVLNYTGGEYKNNLIYKNYGATAFGSGAGMWLNNTFSRPKTILNNTIIGNSAITGTPGVYGSGGSLTNFRNNIVWGNVSPLGNQVGGGIVVRYSDVQGGVAGAGNVNLDPMFDSTNYYLRSNSPCADIGDSSLIYNDPPDPNNPSFAKWPARGTLRNDLGAYGGPGSMVISNSVVSVQSNLLNNNPEGFYLNQNYPNPFNPVTNLGFGISDLGFVSLKVYNAIGQVVAVLVNEKKSAGSYSVNFNASNFSSGIYFYKLEVDNVTIDTKKMTLIK